MHFCILLNRMYKKDEFGGAGKMHLGENGGDEPASEMYFLSGHCCFGRVQSHQDIEGLCVNLPRGSKSSRTPGPQQTTTTLPFGEIFLAIYKDHG